MNGADLAAPVASGRVPFAPVDEGGEVSRWQRAITVLLAVGHPVLRAGYRALLVEDPDVAIAWELASASSVISHVTRSQPSVVLLDAKLPHLNVGLLIKTLRSMRVAVVVTDTEDPQRESVRTALALGAAGYINAAHDSGLLVHVVRIAAAGGVALPERCVDALLMPARPQRVAGLRMPPELGLLTDREVTVLCLLTRGLTNAEIAEALTVAETTVK